MWQLVDDRDEKTIPRLMSVLDEEDTTYRRAAVKTPGSHWLRDDSSSPRCHPQ